MALRIDRKQHGNVSVLELQGRLTFGSEELLLNDELRRAIAGRRNRMVIDFGGVDRMDSAGLGALLYARAELRRAGGGLALSGLRPAQIKQILTGGLESAFSIFNSEEDAIASLSPFDPAALSDATAKNYQLRN
jgi:anti-anti-sigma factor